MLLTENQIDTYFRLCLLLQRYTFWSNSQRFSGVCWWCDNCACYCKDTHFEAIHNASQATLVKKLIVLATAKIHILKQFTTSAGIIPVTNHCACYCKDTHFEAIHNPSRGSTAPWRYCACYCKDTHFEAIHNNVVDALGVVDIVLATAKIHILKQFTTEIFVLWSRRVLCLLLQRYTFWSNSQRRLVQVVTLVNCACYCKDTHFEAINNQYLALLFYILIVLATAKIHILKQFTTCLLWSDMLIILCLLLQRYTFWSNSQRVLVSWFRQSNCACYCKDTHFEAIHNDYLPLYINWYIVLATAKIHILKQFTTKFLGVRLNSLLCLLLQRYTFWSNSQPP